MYLVLGLYYSHMARCRRYLRSVTEAFERSEYPRTQYIPIVAPRRACPNDYRIWTHAKAQRTPKYILNTII